MAPDTRGLSLYQYDSCPFCARVRHALDALDIELEIRDVMLDRSHLQDLVEATGRTTVPCLRIDGEAGDTVWMHESLDIIRYLDARYGQGGEGATE